MAKQEEMSEDEGEEDEEDNYSSDDDDGKFGMDIGALRKRDEERNADF